MVLKLIMVASVFIFVGLVLGAVPTKEVEIVTVVVSPVNDKIIHESDDVVFRLYKGAYVPVKFEDAYQTMLNKNRIQIKAELQSEQRAKK